MKRHKVSLYHSFSFAIAGISSSIKSETNFRIHIVAALIAISMGLYFQISSQEWLWIFLAISLVFAAELINTAIESLANHVSLEYHPLIKKD